MKTVTLLLVALVVCQIRCSASDTVGELNPEFIEFEHEGEPWVGIYLVADSGTSTADYGPIVLCPKVLVRRVSSGRDVSDLVTGYGNPESIRIALYRWHIRCDDVLVRIQESGFYTVTILNGKLVLSPLKIAVPAVGATVDARRSALLKAIGKEAQPGATDNPDDAQRLREDH